MRITHKADYAVRAMTALAIAEQEQPGVPVKREVVAERESIPPAFLDDILRALRNGGLTASQRGAEGGWRHRGNGRRPRRRLSNAQPGGIRA